MSECRIHRYILYEYCAARDGRQGERELLTANDLPVLRAAMVRLGAKGWRVRIWDEEERHYVS
jgi:hypothetical protein